MASRMDGANLLIFVFVLLCDQAVEMQLDDMVGGANGNDDTAENHVTNAFLRDAFLILDSFVQGRVS